MSEKENKNVSANAEKSPKTVAKKKIDGKPGFFKRLGGWFKGLKSEVKKVTWASRKSTIKNFGIVLGIIIACAVVIGAVDLGLGYLFKFLNESINII